MNYFTLQLLRSLCIFSMLVGAVVLANSFGGGFGLSLVGVVVALVGWFGWQGLSTRYKSLIQERARPSAIVRWFGIVLAALAGLLMSRLILIGLANVLSGTQMSGELATGFRMHGLGMGQLVLMLIMFVAGVAILQSNRQSATPKLA